MDLWVLVAGLAMLVVALPLAGRRVFFLYRLITSGQPAPDRLQNVTKRLGEAIRTQVVEVFAQEAGALRRRLRRCSRRRNC